ncbi:hypothetical protein MTO96_018029 [Rhipicephalus appendiculatus]
MTSFMNAEHNSLTKLAAPSVPPPTQGVDPLATQSAGEDEIVDSVWVAASLKADGYEVIVDGGEPLSSSCDTGKESCADGSLSSLLGSSSETCLAGGSRTSSGTTCTDNGLPTTILADDTPTEMDFAVSQGNDDDASHPEGSWTTVIANRKPASTARPRTELIAVGIQLPPGTLTPELPLYDLLASIIAAANLSLKTSAEVTLQAKPAQSLAFLKTNSPLTAHLLLSLTHLELNGAIRSTGGHVEHHVWYNHRDDLQKDIASFGLPHTHSAAAAAELSING